MNPSYDVFLSHSSADKPAVEELARKLQDAGIEPFLDKWHLIPGDPWQEALEEALGASRTCAVFLGPKGLGSWQNEEIPLCQSKCRLDRTKHPGAETRSRWHDTDRASRTERWRGCCHRRVLRWKRWRVRWESACGPWSAGAVTRCPGLLQSDLALGGGEPSGGDAPRSPWPAVGVVQDLGTSLPPSPKRFLCSGGRRLRLGEAYFALEKLTSLWRRGLCHGARDSALEKLTSPWISLRRPG